MTTTILRAAADDDLLQRIRGLLDVAFAGDFDETDWQHVLGGWHVVVERDGQLVAHAAVVPRVLYIADEAWRTGYVEAAATLPHLRRQGLGSTVMADAARLIRERFDIGALSTGSATFYERLGWERWRGPTYVRRGGELIRTPDEDDAVMVLRFGPSLDLDLSAPIACDARTGDDW